ncbi:MAG: Cna B-type domain-containing protein [Clostridiales bacterium]|nr:Cna B-type domain-containing protein [Clostridiales bacterium]
MRRRKLREKIIASALCAVMAFGNIGATSAFASEEAALGIEAASEPAAQAEGEPAAEALTETVSQPTPEPVPDPTPEATPEPTAEPVVTTPEPTVEPQPTEEPTAEPTQEPKAQAEPAEEPTQEPKAEPTQQPTEEPAQDPAETPTTEPTPEPTVESQPTEEPEAVLNEAVQLKKEFHDGNGNLITVTADVEAESFQAEASAITMEVKGLSPSEDTYMKDLIQEDIPEGMELGDYIFYDIAFMVDGQETEPLKAIKLTFAGNKLPIEDTEKANVIYLDYADPEVEGDKDEIVEISQKQELVKAGWNAVQIEESDVSEIIMNADGTADQIQMEGRDSTFYGCYVEKEIPQLVFTHEDDDVVITVSAEEEGIIPEGVELSVTPITAESEETKAQYEKVAQQIQEKVAEEEKEVAGFLAYDITFVDGEGNKVEPNGEVKVSMNYKEAAVPESVAEIGAENTEVSVLHLEEDANGDVQNVVDMAQADQLETLETTVVNEVQAVEVMTESFSAFTITWTYLKYNSYYSRNFTVNVEYVSLDAEGNKKEITVDDVNVEDIDLGTESETIDLTDYWKSAKGYVQDEIKVGSVTGETISALKKSSYEEETGGWYPSTSTYYQIEYQKEDGTYESWLDTKDKQTSGTIYFVYTETDIEIVDNIITDGSLKAQNKQADKVEGATYQWQKCDSKDGSYTNVEKQNFQNGSSNLSEDGSQLYPAYDKGARYWYKVTVTYKDGTVATSAPYQVPYFDELQNGGFETPDYDTHVQVTNEEYKEEGIWQSTGEGEGVNIEIVTTQDGGDIGAYNWHGDSIDAEDGDETDQFAEINCESAGALYQDVLTMEGKALNYWLSHRARGTRTNVEEYDEMYLIIMPTKTAVENNLTTQGNLEEYLNTIGVRLSTDITQKETDVPLSVNVSDVLVLRITSSDFDWHDISKVAGYTPTASLTRFFFMSGKTASGNNTVGNFVDAVGFSQDLPPVRNDEFTLQVKKEIKGLPNADVNTLKEAIQFKLSATDKSGNVLTEEQLTKLFGKTVILGSEMETSLDGKTLSYTIPNRPIDSEYILTITEENAELGGYTVKSSSQVTINDVAGETTEGISATVDSLKGKTTAIVSFTNSYESASYKNINFTKVWDDNGNEYKTRPSSLDVTLSASVTYENEDGITVTDPLETTAFIAKDDSATHTITGDTWKTSWKVPVYYNVDEDTKVKIDYTVAEGNINSDYVYKKGELQTGDGSTYQSTADWSNVTTTGDGGTGTTPLSRKMARATQANALAADNSSSLAPPTHRKYIEYDRNAGEYTLNLDVTGKKGTTEGVDVLFVIDTSGSMGGRYSDLLDEVQTLLTENGGIIDQIFQAEGNQNSVAYVSFSDKNGTYSSSWYTTDTKANLKQRINKLSATGGTNWTYAMNQASLSLDGRSGYNNDKVVIFLSDGEPTYTWNGYRESGNGSTTEDSYYKDVNTVINNSSSLKSSTIYSVYLTNDTKAGMEKITTPKTHAILQNGTNLGTALTNILNKVIPTYKNVTITDTLSEYVVFAESNPTVTVRKGSEVLPENQYTVTKTTNSISVKLLGGASLEDGATYTISFKVKPSDAANSYHSTNGGYPPGMEGDSGTGSSSEGQEGFDSNDADNTTLTYQIDGDTTGTQTAYYPVPVVQVTTHKLIYQKNWIHPNEIEEPTEDVILNVTYTDGSHKTITLTKEGNYRFEETVPVTKEIASVSEQEIEGYTSACVVNNGTEAVITNSYSQITSGSITVKKEWTGKGPKSPVQVSLWRSASNGTVEKYGETVTLQDSNWEYTWANLPKSEGSGENYVKYTYAVREENIPENYTSNIVYTTEGDTTVATITNVYDENCADEDYYIANVLQTELLTITKNWEDNGNSQGVRPGALGITVNGMNFTLSGTDNSWTKSHTILKRADRSYNATENLAGYETYYDATLPTISSTDKGVHITFVNEIKTKSITVQKVWNDGECETRPESISFEIWYRTAGSTEEFKRFGEQTYSITAEDGDADTSWKKVIRNLPIAYEYDVREVNVAEGYHSSVTSSGDGFTITNTLDWNIRKTSKQLADEQVENLDGAEFELKNPAGDVIATGTSGSDGIIEWTDAEGQTFDKGNLDGEYKLHETKAPDGYLCAAEDWTLTFADGLLVELNGQEVKGTAQDGVIVAVTNEAIYNLPSTGGNGIYWYMISGVLLMLAGVLILYKIKRGEVLKS